MGGISAKDLADRRHDVGEWRAHLNPPQSFCRTLQAWYARRRDHLRLSRMESVGMRRLQSPLFSLTNPSYPPSSHGLLRRRPFTLILANAYEPDSGKPQVEHEEYAALFGVALSLALVTS